MTGLRRLGLGSMTARQALWFVASIAPSRTGGVSHQTSIVGQFAMELSFSRRIHNAHVHRLGVQIDPAVECVPPMAESHHWPP